MKALVAPSILSADFSKLADEVKEVEAAGADWIHVDVMDGHFVPNITIGPVVVSGLKPVTKLPLDCHLMVSQPENWIEAFAKAGAASITIHTEPTNQLPELLKRIRQHGCQAGVSLNPPTELSAIEPVLDLVDLVLVMSVNPGFGGQKFISESLDKVRQLVKIRGDRNYLIEIDGGINAETARQAREAGVDVFVAGNAIFKASDRAAALGEIRTAIQ